MAAEVFKIETSKLSVFREMLLQRPSTELLASTNPYESFRVRDPEGLIIGYTSGKIVANTPKTAHLVSELIERLGAEGKEYD